MPRGREQLTVRGPHLQPLPGDVVSYIPLGGSTQVARRLRRRERLRGIWCPPSNLSLKCNKGGSFGSPRFLHLSSWSRFERFQHYGLTLCSTSHLTHGWCKASVACAMATPGNTWSWFTYRALQHGPPRQCVQNSLNKEPRTYIVWSRHTGLCSFKCTATRRCSNRLCVTFTA